MPSLRNKRKVSACMQASLGCVYALTASIVLLLTFPHTALAQDPTQQLADFETHIRPILASKCVSCHGAEKQEGGLRLDSRQSIVAGGESGPALLPGDPGSSLLIEALKYESFEMPPAGRLPQPTVHEFEKWIASGAVWPEAVQLRSEAGLITDADRQWWAFRPLDRSPLPESRDANWDSNPVDRYILQSLQQNGLSPAPAAEPLSLLRRLYLDLVGMPPTPREVQAYLHDPNPESAYRRLVDSLLDDPRYGEHWARHWLDLVRYSESDGWNQDAYRPHIWRYRDYVVGAFNSDKPYPDFVREQLAGDEIPGDNPEHLEAAGLLRLGIYEYNQRDARGLWNDTMNEITDVTGDVFLGLSMQCCRCHDHKFDPLPQKDYFRLRACFEPLSWRDDLVAATEQEKQAHAAAQAKWLLATESIRTQIEALEAPYKAKKWLSTVDKFPLDIQACFHMPVGDRTSWQNQMAYLVSRQFLEEGGGPFSSLSKQDKARRDELLKELSQFDDLKPADLPAVMTATDFAGLASPTYIPDDPTRQSIPPGFLSVLPDFEFSDYAPDHSEIVSNTTGRRTALAKWIADPNNPLTPRVMVNRVWQQHFGRGLVSASNDFGTQGQPPSHPALLDWLTAFYIEGGWRMKDLHRLILNSNAWKQSATHPDAAENQRLDPQEKLVWRWQVRRLQAEQIRDSMLLASGELDPTLGGPSVKESQPRRSIYLQSFRNKNDTFLHGFDIANGLKSVAVRDATTTPTQALLLMNGAYTLERAEAFASRLQATHPDQPAAMLTDAFQTCWGRPPSTPEQEQAMDFLGIQSAQKSPPVSHATWVDFCHILFNSNPFLYVE